MIDKLYTTKFDNHSKIPGIFHDNSPENQARVEEFLQYLETRSSFVFSIFRDSVVSAVLQEKKEHPQESYEEILVKVVQEKLGPIEEEQLAIFLEIARCDLNETLKNSPPRGVCH